MVSAKDIKILIVDDDQDLLETISTTFRLFKFDVHSLGSGNEAIDFLKSNDVTIVISDIRMPNGSGVELLRFIKSRNTTTPKVLFISGFSDYSLKQMFHMGVDGFFTKPFNAGAVRDAISISLLDLNERWRVAPKTMPTMNLNKNFFGINDAVEKKHLLIGRGGFFVAVDKGFPEEDSLVKFELRFRDGVPCADLSGLGYIRWVEVDSTATSPSGVGVEIVHLDDRCRNMYVSWLKRQIIVPYIPMPT